MMHVVLPIPEEDVTILVETDKNRMARKFRIKDADGEIEFTSSDLRDSFGNIRGIWPEVKNEYNPTGNALKEYRLVKADAIEHVGRVAIINEHGRINVTPAEIREKILEQRQRDAELHEEMMLSIIESFDMPKGDQKISDGQLFHIVEALKQSNPGFLDSFDPANEITIEEIPSTDDDLRESLGLPVLKTNQGPARQLQDKLAEKFGPLPQSLPSKTFLGTVSSFAASTFQRAAEVVAKPVARETFKTAMVIAVAAARLSEMGISPVAPPVASTQPDSGAERQQCTLPPLPDRLDTRIRIWRETHPFYERMINGTPRERRMVEWVDDAARAAQDMWDYNREFYQERGFTSAEQIFLRAMRFAEIESRFNDLPTNRLNPEVAGPHHISEDSFHGVLRNHPWLVNLPGFEGKMPTLGMRYRGYTSTVIAMTLQAEDEMTAKRYLGELPGDYAPHLYSPYNNHVDGAPLGSRLLRAAIENPYKTVNGRRVPRTAVDIAGRGVANDNPSLFFKRVQIRSGHHTRTITVPLTIAEHFQKLRTRYNVIAPQRLAERLTTSAEVDREEARLRRMPQYAPICA